MNCSPGEKCEPVKLAQKLHGKVTDCLHMTSTSTCYVGTVTIDFYAMVVVLGRTE